MDAGAWVELVGIAGALIAIYVKLQIDLANVKKDILHLADQLERHRMDCAEVAKHKADKSSVEDMKEVIVSFRKEIREDLHEIRTDIKTLLQ